MRFLRAALFPIVAVGALLVFGVGGTLYEELRLQQAPHAYYVLFYPVRGYASLGRRGGLRIYGPYIADGPFSSETACEHSRDAYEAAYGGRAEFNCTPMRLDDAAKLQHAIRKR